MAANRRSYGTGALTVRKDAAGRESWYGRWYIGTDRVQRRIGPKRSEGGRDGLTQTQAEAELRRRRETTEASSAPMGSLTVEEAGRRLVASLEARGRKASTLANYESALRIHLVPFFGSKALSRIAVEDVEAFIALRRELSPKSIRNLLGALHNVFEFARARPNPVADARRPDATDSDPDIRFLDSEELEAVLRHTPADHLGPTERVLYLTAAMTGLRQGELFGLRWQDVDWTAGRIRVRRSYARKREGRPAEFGKPKSKRSSRSVPMHDRVAGELDSHFKRSAYQHDADLVFAHPHTGGPLDGSKVTKRFKLVLDAAGVRRVRFHDLRHTFGTRMAAAGVPMRTLQEWLGHRSIATTMIYADYAPSDHEAELVSRAFAVPSSRSSSHSGPNLSESSSTSEHPTSTNTAWNMGS